MLNRNAFAIALFLGVVVGCVTNEVVRRSTVNAQSTSSNARFRECVIYDLNHDGDLRDLADNAKPVGSWTPVGGAGPRATLLCR